MHSRCLSTTKHENENESEPATKSAASSELKAVSRTVHRAVDITDDDEDGVDVDVSGAAILPVVSNKSLLSMTRPSTHRHLHTTVPNRRLMFPFHTKCLELWRLRFDLIHA